MRSAYSQTCAGFKWLLSDERICTPHHLGRFPNPDNKCQFFECAMNFKNLLNCSLTNSTDVRRDERIAKNVSRKNVQILLCKKIFFNFNQLYYLTSE